MNNLVVWSGGLDSTLALILALEDKDTVETCYINLSNNKDKTEMELRARGKIRKELEDYYKVKIPDRSIQTGINGDFGGAVGYRQASFWILGLIYSLKSKDQFDKISFGYIKSDDFWHFKASFVEAFDKLLDLCDTRLSTKPKLCFPTEWHTKVEIIKIFRDYSETFKTTEKSAEMFIRLLDLVKTCEMPILNSFYEYDECGNCDTCKHKKEALAIIEKEDALRKLEKAQVDEQVREQAELKEATEKMAELVESLP